MANNDNAMARFLFAILQQKCLKDVDWNEVARNPVLSQEITNGHAARMRFSRFRQQVLGLQPQKRNRTGAGSKSRVTKKKKEDDHPKPKKEDEEETKSGSGIGNIKNEAKAIKSERKSISECVGEPGQPPVPMMPTPDRMKTEAGIVNPYSQHLRQPSVISVGSPSVKKERLPSTGNPHTATPLMPEPSPLGILATTPATSSTSSTPYIDNNNHRMQMRLLTPSSDTEGMSATQGFFPNSPCPSTAELLQQNHGQYHSQRHHSQQHQHQHSLVGAGSPPLSASAPSPYDFSQHQHGCDITTTATVNSSVPGTDSSPWHSQHQHQHHNSQHSQSQCQSQIYPTFGLGIASSGFTALDYTNTNTINSNPFCPENHHSHPLHHHHSDEDAPHDMVDSLGLHHNHQHMHHSHSHSHHHDVSAAAAAMEGSMFRERELELELGIGLTNPVKGEWDGEGFGI